MVWMSNLKIKKPLSKILKINQGFENFPSNTSVYIVKTSI